MPVWDVQYSRNMQKLASWQSLLFLSVLPNLIENDINPATKCKEKFRQAMAELVCTSWVWIDVNNT